MNLILCQDCYESPSCIVLDDYDALHLYMGKPGVFDEEKELVIRPEHYERFRRAILMASEERGFRHTMGYISIFTLACRPRAHSDDLWRINIWDSENRISVAFDNDEGWALAAVLEALHKRHEAWRRRCKE